MTDKVFRLTFITLFDLALYPIAIGAVYAWLKAVHTPLWHYQRRMLMFVTIWFAGICIASPICAAMALWIFSLKQVEILGTLMGLGWTWASIKLLKRMSSPGGRLSVGSE
jgi:hypothetical protein